jgi:hypothetical protein
VDARGGTQSRTAQSREPRNLAYTEPPSDAEIERGLRERAVSDPRAAEILLRWLQRPGRVEQVLAGDEPVSSE